MPNDKETWWTTYCTAHSKCQSARDAGRLYIQVVPYDGGYTLYARRNQVAANCVPNDYITSCDWAAAVADKVRELGCCEAPTEKDEFYRKDL